MKGDMKMEANSLLERIANMPLYKDKHGLYNNIEKEGKFIKDETAKRIAKKMILGNEPLKKIIEYTELSESRIKYIKKKLSRDIFEN